MVDLGDLVPLTVDIRDSAGNPANATAVTLTISLPDGTVVTPTPTNPTAGRYQYDFPTSQPGRHSVRWVATGSNASSFTDGFDVRPADPGYIVSLSDTKEYLNIPAANTTNDEELRGYIEAATQVIENYRNEALVRRTVVEQIDTGSQQRMVDQAAMAFYDSGAPRRRIALGVTPIISVTSIARVDGTYTWNLAQLSVDTNKATITALFGPLFYGLLQITYLAGYAYIPANYVLAAKIIIEHLWQLQRQPTIGTGTALFSRGEMDASTVSGYGVGFAIPNRAAELLGGRPPVVA